MNQLPETGFLRLPQIIGDPKAEPPIPPIIPIKKSCWWAGVASGRFPKPVKLGPRVTVWRVEDNRAAHLMAQQQYAACRLQLLTECKRMLSERKPRAEILAWLSRAAIRGKAD